MNLKHLIIFVITTLLMSSCDQSDKAHSGQDDLSNGTPMVLRPNPKDSAKFKKLIDIEKEVFTNLPVETIGALDQSTGNESKSPRAKQLPTIRPPKRLKRLTTNEIALVDGVPINISEFNNVFATEALDNLPNYLQREYNKNRPLFIKQLINNKVIELAASVEDFSKDAEYRAAVDDALRKINMQFFYKKYITNKVDIDQDKFKDYYQKNSAEFVKKAQVRVSHILVAVKPNAYLAEITNAKNKINKILKLAKEGESFAELAGSESDCPSRVNGGDLGFYTKGQKVLDPEFEKVAFSLEKDEISDVVETAHGYHIIKLTDRIPARKQSFDEVKDLIKTKVTDQTESKAFQQLLGSLTNKFNVIRNEKLIRDLTQTY